MDSGASYGLEGGAGLTAAAVTERLGIGPDRQWEIGDRVSNAGRRALRTRETSNWEVKTKIEDAVALASQIERLLARLEPHRDELWKLAGEGYEARWLCWVGAHSLEPYFQLEHSLVARMNALPGDVLLDVMSRVVPEPNEGS